MNHHYKDIIERINEKPKWWDEHAVPRYCEFSPNETADIYSDMVALVRIQCQSCGTPFKVCFSQGASDRIDIQIGQFRPDWSLRESIINKTIHYGDPPNACPEFCAAGATMNSIPIKVLEFWERSSSPYDWVRVPELEIWLDD